MRDFNPGTQIAFQKKSPTHLMKARPPLENLRGFTLNEVGALPGFRQPAPDHLRLEIGQVKMITVNVISNATGHGSNVL